MWEKQKSVREKIPRLFSIKKQKCSTIVLSFGFCLIEEILHPALIPLKWDLFCVLEPQKQSLVIPWGAIHPSELSSVISSPFVVKAMRVSPEKNSYILHKTFVLNPTSGAAWLPSSNCRESQNSRHIGGKVQCNQCHHSCHLRAQWNLSSQCHHWPWAAPAVSVALVAEGKRGRTFP